MIYIHMISFLYLLLTLALWKGIEHSCTASYKVSKSVLFSVFGAALLLRILLAYNSFGFESDTACFAAWAERMAAHGPSGFYSAELFADYPPGYLYLLGIIGKLTALSDIPAFSGLHLLLLKTPAILCDCITSACLYREGLRKSGSATALLLTAAYLFHSAVILNSSVWGQVDSVYTLAVIFACISLCNKRMMPAYLAFGLGILIKPQTLLLAPVMLVGFLDHFRYKKFSLNALFTNLVQISGVICGCILLAAPFGLSAVFSKYAGTLGSYTYSSVNAYNLWTLLGQNWSSQDNILFLWSNRMWGTVCLIIIVLVVLLLGLRMGKDTSKYYLLGAFLFMGTFTGSVRMHERYLYPAVILLFLYWIHKPYPAVYWHLTTVGLLHFYNVAHVLFFYDPYHYQPRDPVMYLVSAGMVLSFFLFCMGLYRIWRQLPDSGFPIKHLGLWIVVLLYSLFALYDLGGCKAPTTAYSMKAYDTVTFYFEDKLPVSMDYYMAPEHNRNFTLICKDPATQSDMTSNIVLENVFTWQSIPVPSGYRVSLLLRDHNATLLELSFRAADGTQLLPSNAADYPALFDEAELVPERSSFRNSMYFDEIYHARTAYEYLNGLPTYETTHPPLGKIFIALGIALFGMNPFGWRIIGTLFGIAMLPFLYFFGKKVCKSTGGALLCCILLACDFMHFTQTRIATIDVYITFFVIAMYYFMFRYYETDFANTSAQKSFLPLGLCGIMMGLGIACKWTGAYAGLGLAILFFLTLWNRRKHIPVPRTIIFCILFFVLIPAGIYIVSYLPFVSHPGDSFWSKLINNQIYMLDYHKNINATHPFASPWYTWPVILRPIWYYSGVLSDVGREGISSFGNPVVWWIGIPAFIHTVYTAVRHRNRTSLFLTIGFLAQYLPWIFVTRITFIYHYFPSVPFLILMIGHSFSLLTNGKSRRQCTCYIALYSASAFLLFILFYPVLAGQPTTVSYVSNLLRWFDNWILVAG